MPKIVKISSPYHKNHTQDFGPHIRLCDHLNGFDPQGRNRILDEIQVKAQALDIRPLVTYHQILPQWVLNNYPYLDIRFDSLWQWDLNFRILETDKKFPEPDFNNFLVTMLGSAHQGRMLLCAALARMNWLDFNYTKKNFAFTIDQLDGAIQELAPPNLEPQYYKSLVNYDWANIFSTNQHGSLTNEKRDIPWLDKLDQLIPNFTQSFVHVVSETLPTSYVPFVTEKFLHSIVTQGLFVAYAQPKWHEHINKHYGFVLYQKVFDYSFDNNTDPIGRLLEIVDMLLPYSQLTKHDWHDLYLLEKPAIEFNYHHYLSEDYLRYIEGFDTQDWMIEGCIS
jgi:hypothetical protein